jgi:hypothetical protein
MPVIQPIESAILPQGEIPNGAAFRARGSDFDTGSGLEALGRGIQDTANTLYQAEEAKEVTQAHVDAAQQRLQWTQELRNRYDQAKPGDDSFAQGVMDDMAGVMSQGADTANTRAGQAARASLGANLVSEFGQKAIGMQAALDGQEAQNQYSALVQAAGATINADPSQYSAAAAQVKQAIEDPRSIFGRVPQPVRNELLKKAEGNLALANIMSIASNNPGGLLGQVDPSNPMLNAAVDALIKNNLAPGGKTKFTPEVKANLPGISATAATQNVNPAILAGMQSQTQVPDDPAAQAKSMNTLLGRYGGSYEMALAAYHMGTDAFDANAQIWGPAWQEHLPAEVQNYVDTVMSDSGQVTQDPLAAGQAVQPVAAPVRAEAPQLAIPGWDKLTWEQQQASISHAVQTRHLELSMAVRMREEADRAEKKGQETVIDVFLKQIRDPKGHGQITTKAILDSSLTPQQKEMVFGWWDAHRREALAEAQTRSNPIAVRTLISHLWADEGTPGKTGSMAETNQWYLQGKISLNDWAMVQKIFESNKDSTPNAFRNRLNSIIKDAHRAMDNDILLKFATQDQARAKNDFEFQARETVKKWQTEGKDLTPLFDPNSRDYLLKEGWLDTYKLAPLSTHRDQATNEVKAKQGALKPGQTQGGYRYLGGDPASATSWEKE